MSDRTTALRLLDDLSPPNGSDPPSDALVGEAVKLARLRDDPDALLKKAVQSFMRAEKSGRHCVRAAEAARQLEATLHDLLRGEAKLYRFESLRRDANGAVAVCRVGHHTCELPIHPDIDLDRLDRLQPWDYVRVREDAVVGVWDGDPCLRRAAYGEVVEFKEYAGSERRLAHVTRHGGTEDVVEVTEELRSQELTPGARLILQRDQPHWAIGILPRQTARSRFEVPSEQISRTTFDDLAGWDWLAERLVLEVLKRIIFADEIQGVYDLDPLRGMLLLSRKPGMGKTSFARALANCLTQVGRERGFDVVLYHVKPNETKSMWHGEDSRIVREDLFGAISARRDQERERPLFQLVVMDEIDSLGRRPGVGDSVTSSAQSDALESLLVEMDGFIQGQPTQGPASHLLVIGMSNRPDRIDEAIKRPGRLGDLVLEMDDLDQQAAERICAIYGRGERTPWQLNGKATTGPSADELSASILRPALGNTFPLVILHYFNDAQLRFDVTAGQILSGAHYREAMNRAKSKAAERKLLEEGNPAVTYDDVAEGLLDVATSLAQQMASDPQALARQLDLHGAVVRVEAVPRFDLETHSCLRVPANQT